MAAAGGASRFLGYARNDMGVGVGVMGGLRWSDMGARLGVTGWLLAGRRDSSATLGMTWKLGLEWQVGCAGVIWGLGLE